MAAGIKSGGSVVVPCVRIQSGLVSIVVNELLVRISSTNQIEAWPCQLCSTKNTYSNFKKTNN